MDYIKHQVVAIVLSLSFGLMFSCTSSYKASDQSSDKPQSDATLPRKDASIETELGSLQVVTSGELVGELEYIDSSIDNSNSDKAPQTGFVAVDKWDDSIAHDGIEALNTEQIPTGLWVGETKEDFARMTSRHIAIETDLTQESNRAFGVVVFGEGDPPPPDQIPDIGYLLEDDRDDYRRYGRSPIEGFAYTILDGYIDENGGFHFRIGVAEAYQSCCVLETSYQSNPGVPTYYQYQCMPELSMDEVVACAENYPECPIDYHKSLLCFWFGPCICTQDGCVANMNRTIRFDLTIDGSEIEGIVTNLGLDSPTTEVRLRKVR